MTGLYSYYDKKAQEYSAPFPQKNDATATRAFRKFLSDVPEYAKDDFSLMRLADWDSSTCGIVSLEEIPIEVDILSAIQEAR